MLEEAEEAFRTYAAHQKGGNKGKRSSKTENLIRSFTVDSPSYKETASIGGKPNIAAQRKPFQKAKSVEEFIASEEVKFEHEVPVNGVVSAGQTQDESKDACVKGLVKDRANIFLQHTPPVSGERVETTHAQVKKWIASQPHTVTGTDESERYFDIKYYQYTPYVAIIKMLQFSCICVFIILCCMVLCQVVLYCVPICCFKLWYICIYCIVF